MKSFKTIVDIFADEILDNLLQKDLDNLESVIPCVIRMYKSSYLDQCLSYPKNMYVECSYCSKIDNGKYRRGTYICKICLAEIISISIS